MCRVLCVSRSGYYLWLKAKPSPRTLENRHIVSRIKASWEESGKVYGYRKVHEDLLEEGIRLSPNRTYRLMSANKMQAKIGYKKRRPLKYGTPAVTAANRLAQDFEVDRPDKVWVSDITYIRTIEGWLYLAVVIDLFSRRVVGWSMQPRIETSITLDALTMALKRRQPMERIVLHSDQGTQYSSIEFQSYMRENNIDASMSRRGNCYDNACAESFFNLLKRERIRRRVYQTRDEARADIFDYIELFYNPTRRHGHNNKLSPMKFEMNYFSEKEKCLGK